MEVLDLKNLSYEALCAVIAQVVHAANRQYTEVIGGRAVNPVWEQLPEEQKQSLIKAICETIINPKTLEEAHDAWCVARKAQGYTLGVRIDHIRKTHTNLVRFNELPFEEQLKDALFLGITSIFASALDLCGSTPEAVQEKLEDADAEDAAIIAGTIGEAAEAALDKLDNMGPNVGISPEFLHRHDDNNIPSGRDIKDCGGPPEVLSPEEIKERQEAILAAQPAEFTAADVADAVFGGTPVPDPNIADSDEEIKDTAREATGDDYDALKNQAGENINGADEVPGPAGEGDGVSITEGHIEKADFPVKAIPDAAEPVMDPDDTKLAVAPDPEPGSLGSTVPALPDDEPVPEIGEDMQEPAQAPAPIPDKVEDKQPAKAKKAKPKSKK